MTASFPSIICSSAAEIHSPTRPLHVCDDTAAAAAAAAPPNSNVELEAVAGFLSANEDGWDSTGEARTRMTKKS